MKKLLLLVFVGLVLACNQSNRSDSKISQLLPPDTDMVIQIPNVSTFNSDLKNNTFSSLLANNEHNKIGDLLSSLSHINTTNKVVVAFVNGQYSILTKSHDSLFDSEKLYHQMIDSISILSTDNDALKHFKKTEDNYFENLDLANASSSFSIYVNTNKTKNIGNALFSKNTTRFSDWMLMDFNVSPDELSFGSISISRDTLSNFIDIFKQTVPQENKLAEITPLDNRGLLSFTYDNFMQLRHNLSDFNKTQLDSTATFEIIETFSEVGAITLKNNEDVIVAHSIDALNTNELLHSDEHKIDSHRNVDLFQFEDSTYFKSVFDPLVTLDDVTYYTNINNFFLFANNEDNLKEIITNYLNGTVLSKDQNFQELKKSMSDESSLLVLSTPIKLQSILLKLFGVNFGLNNLSRFKFSGFQLVQDDGFVHINGVVKKSKTNAQRNSISEEFSVGLDADILTRPHFVTNHRTQQKEIVVQDINNNLYLISNKGKVLWKKQLHGPILGDIQQVDLYRNGRLQLAFATPRRVYIIDRNGRNVSPFPLKFNNDITQPLSVFDYDNNKNYRFTVTQSNVVIMYDRNGKRVSGFRYQNSNENLVTQPKHFRVNGRDYIVFATTNDMKVLNRRGQSRISVSEKVNYSGNPIFYYNNLFATTTINGELVQINLKGQLSKQSLSLVSDHMIDATSKTLASISENKLTIKQRSQELDFGNYTQPKIFYINDKIYVAITDLQSQKIHLFDSQSKAIPNFPVYGNSVIDLANIDSDNNLEFVTKGENNTIILYQKN